MKILQERVTAPLLAVAARMGKPRKAVKANIAKKASDKSLIYVGRNPRILASITLLKNHSISKDARIMELGCGDGSTLLEISRALNSTNLYGVDIDRKALEKATERGIKVHIVDLDNDRLPFPDGFFDIALMEEVIEHLVNPDNAIQEAYRVLKAGGLFLITTPNLAWWLNRLALLLGYQPYWTECSVRYNVGKLKRDVAEPVSGHLRLYTQRALKKLLQLYGFQIICAKGVTYNELPSIFKHIDRVLSKSQSLAEIMAILAQK